MPIGIYDSATGLKQEGGSIDLKLEILDKENILLSWTIPQDAEVYDGCVVLLSTQPIDQSNYPTNGTKYIGSPSLRFPRDTISGAQVVRGILSR
jgi:hypothetical protein